MRLWLLRLIAKLLNRGGGVKQLNTRPYSDELTHYGVLGMKWGVRRYRDKNGKLTAAGKKRYDAIKRDGGRVIERGTNFQRISDKNETRFKKKHTWVSYTPEDNDYYVHAMTWKFNDEGRRFIYKNKFTNVRDLVIPSNEKQVDTFVELYKKKQIRMVDELSSGIAYKVAVGKSVSEQSAIKSLFKQKLTTLDDNRIRDVVYPTFINLYGQVPISKIYTRQLTKEGYNAIVDDHDRLINNSIYGGKVRPDDPLIVINPSRILRKTGSENIVYDDNFKAVEKRLYRRSKEHPKKPSDLTKRLFE